MLILCPCTAMPHSPTSNSYHRCQHATEVGALLFNTARLVYEDGKGGPSVNLSSGKALFVGDKVCKTETNSEEMGRFDHSAPDSIESPLLPRERVDSNSPTRLGTTAAGAANEPSLEHLPIADAEQEPYEEKVEKDAEAAAAGASTEEAILEQQDQIQRFQLWWAEGKGKEAAGLHPMLSLLDAAVLADIIAAGANYHNCLSADRLDALQRHISKSNGPGLEALQRALQAKGGAKSQARAVGSVIFKEAMDMFKNPPAEMSKSSLATSSESRELEQSGGKVEQPKLNAGVVADEIFEPPKRFICSESFPPEATVAVRLEPNKASSLVTSLPYGSEVLATAARGTYLQFKLDKGQNNEVQYVWVPRVLDGLVLFVEKSDPVKVEKDAEAAAAVASTEEAILEQQDQIQRFQLWWAEGKGKEAAGLHPMLSLLDAAVLADIIAAGANYHNCLSADRLDALQRHTSKSNGPGLEALQRALQAKGGAKSQARAVGSVIFKEAMDMFKNPPAEMSKSSLATSSESRELEQSGGKVEQPKLNAGVVADEIFEPPKRFICSESFPPEATIAVRLEPNKASSLVTSLPYGSEVLATAARGTYLQFKLDKGQNNEVQYVWVPRVLDGLVLFVEKSDPVKVEKDAEAAAAVASTEEAILEQQDQIQRFQLWWAEGKGKEAAGLHPMLSLLDAAVLADIIAAGANYHNCLSADRLDALQRHTSKSNGPGLEALQRALQAKGGAKSQARAVGSVIFKEAMDMFKNPPTEMSKSSLATSSESRELELSGGKVEQPKLNAGVVADEIFEPPKRFICSESFPPEATVAVRLEPNKASSLVTSLPYGSEVLATAARGTYLQFKLDKGQNNEVQYVWVPRVLDGLVLFVEKSDPVKVEKDAEAAAAVASTEEAILEQQDQIQRFQLWWAEGKGKEAAGLHPMLSLLDAAVLADIIAAGANYHNCLSADRLDALQRHTSKSNGPGLEALQRALQAKGGAKSQARAVGSVIFKEAMDMFKNPPAEMSKSSLATSSESRELELSGGKVEQPKLNAGVVADEIFEPPKRFICSESFPPEATVAVRAAPSHQSEYLTCFPHGTETWLQLRCTLKRVRRVLNVLKALDIAWGRSQMMLDEKLRRFTPLAGLETSFGFVWRRTLQCNISSLQFVFASCLPSMRGTDLADTC